MIKKSTDYGFGKIPRELVLVWNYLLSSFLKRDLVRRKSLESQLGVSAKLALYLISFHQKQCDISLVTVPLIGYTVRFLNFDNTCKKLNLYLKYCKVIMRGGFYEHNNTDNYHVKIRMLFI